MPERAPPDSSTRRTLAEFDRDASCKHNAPAYTCGYRECKPGEPLDATTREGKTIKQVIGEFVDDGRISEIELAEHIKGALRRRKITSIAKIAGIIGISIGVAGGAVTLVLIRRRDEPAGDAK